MTYPESLVDVAPRVLMRAPRHLWLLTPALILVLLAADHYGWFVPMPFLLLMVTVSVSGALAGAISGAISALLMSFYILYAWYAGFGPGALTGELWRVLLAGLVALVIGTGLGAFRDQLVRANENLRTSRRQLDQLNRSLADQVSKRTRELELTQDLLQRNQDRLRRISQRWIEMQETERRNLARNLHDDIGQSLTALRMKLDHGRRITNPDVKTVELLENGIELLDAAVDSIRELSLNLRPSLLDDLGLSAALREHASRQLQLADIDFTLSCEGDDRHVDAQAGITAFRLAQEAIFNILKHAGARRVDLTVRINEDSLDMEIADDGRGFDAGTETIEAHHFGLAGMHERASLAGGTLRVTSTIGTGTTIRLTLPLTRIRLAV